jgi:hypothetical protein
MGVGIACASASKTSAGIGDGVGEPVTVDGAVGTDAVAGGEAMAADKESVATA